MSGRILKGHISRILPEPKDWYGLETLATVNPSTNTGAVTPAITIDWRLRGKNGQLKPGDEVAYCLFDDGTGVIFARMDGANSGFIDYDTTTTGHVVNMKTETTHGDVLNKSNETTEGNVQTNGTTTSQGKITGQGGMAISGGSGGEAASVTGTLKVISGDVSADGISLKGHTHMENGDRAPTGPAQ